MSDFLRCLVSAVLAIGAVCLAVAGFPWWVWLIFLWAALVSYSD